MAHGGTGYTGGRRKRRVRRRSGAGPTGHGVGTPSRKQRVRRRQIKTPIRQAPRQYRPGAPPPRTKPRPKSQRGLITPGGKVVHPTRDRHSAAHAVQALGYRTTAERYGKHTADAGRARIEQVKARRAQNSALKTMTARPGNMLVGTPGFEFSSMRRKSKVERDIAKLTGRHGQATPSSELPRPPKQYQIPKAQRKLYKKSFAGQAERHQQTAAFYQKESAKALRKVKPKKSGLSKLLHKVGDVAGDVVRTVNRSNTSRVYDPEAQDNALARARDEGLPKLGRKVGKYLSRKGEQGQAKQAGLPADTPTGAGEIAKRTAKDISTMAGQAPASLYYTGSAAVEAATGRPQKAKEVVRQLKKHDSVVLTLSGHPGKALKEIKQHPGYAAAELIPGGKALDIGAGRVVRAVAPKGGRVGRAVSRERAPLIAQNSDMTGPRQYSKGLAGKGAQVLHERGVDVGVGAARVTTGARKSKRLYKQAMKERAKADPRRAGRDLTSDERDVALEKAQKLRKKARKVHPAHLSTRQVETRVSREFGQHTSTERAMLDKADKDVKAALKTEHPTAALLVAQRDIKPTVASVDAKLQELAREYPNLDSRARKRANTRTRAELERYRADLHAAERAHPKGEKAPNPVAAETTAAAKRYEDVAHARGRELEDLGVIKPLHAKRRALVPYVTRHMPDVQWDAETQRFYREAKPIELPGGEQLPGDRQQVSVNQIQKHMKANGFDPNPAFLSHRPPQSVRRPRRNQPPELQRGATSGKATQEGSYEPTTVTARGSVRQQQRLIEQSHGWREFIQLHARRVVRTTKETGPRRVVQTFRKHVAAQKEATRLNAQGGERWTVVPVRGAHGTKEQVQAILNPEGADAGLAAREAVEATDPSARWTLVRTTAAMRHGEHIKQLSPGQFARGVGRVRTAFTKAVLTTAPTWPVGNISEATMRSVLEGVMPHEYKIGVMALKRADEVDPTGRLRAKLHAWMGSGHYGSQELDMIDATMRHADPGEQGGLSELFDTVRNLPPAQATGHAWEWWTDNVFKVNGDLEKQFHTAMLGKFITREMGITARKGMRKAAEEAVDGLRGTDTQFQMGEKVARWYGRYDSFSPKVAATKRYYLPFVAWTMNAANFLLHTLPVDHPLATSLLAVSTQASEEWRKQQGYDVMPNWMRGMLPGGKGLRAVGRFTPFGLAADPGGTAAGLFPGFGLGMNLIGKTWFGEPLKDQTVLGAGIDTILGMFVPGWGMAERATGFTRHTPIGGPEGKGAQAFNPFRSYKFDVKQARAFDRLKKADAALKDVKDGDSEALTRALKRRGRARWAVHQATGGKFYSGMKGPGDFQIYISPKGTKAAKQRGREQSRRRKKSSGYGGGTWSGGGGGETVP